MYSVRNLAELTTNGLHHIMLITNPDFSNILSIYLQQSPDSEEGFFTHDTPNEMEDATVMETSSQPAISSVHVHKVGLYSRTQTQSKGNFEK